MRVYVRRIQVAEKFIPSWLHPYVVVDTETPVGHVVFSFDWGDSVRAVAIPLPKT